MAIISEKKFILFFHTEQSDENAARLNDFCVIWLLRKMTSAYYAHVILTQKSSYAEVILRRSHLTFLISHYWKIEFLFFHTEQSDKNAARVNHPCVRLLQRKATPAYYARVDFTLE
jgi:hypothetical protein